MKKIFYLLLILLFIFYIRFSLPHVFAQQAPNNPIDAAPAEPNQPIQPPPTNPNLTTATVKSNMLCVKVGAADEAAKPANCNQPGSTSIGATGFSPISAGAAPTVEAGQLIQTIKDQFGVDMQGAWNEQPLQWFYEKMYQLRQTNPTFAELIRGEMIELIPPIPESIGPNQYSGHVQMTQGYADGEKFMGTLIHELGHVIYNNRPVGMSLKTDYSGLYTGVAGAVTSYASGDTTEQYPEMISYCLTKRPVGGLLSQERWEIYYKTLAERITGGSCL